MPSKKRRQDRKRNRALNDAHNRWRKGVYRRYGGRCQGCGATHRVLHAHHLESKAKHPELRFDPENGVCLCERCHWWFHEIYGPSTTRAEFFRFQNSMAEPYAGEPWSEAAYECLRHQDRNEDEHHRRVRQLPLGPRQREVRAYETLRAQAQQRGEKRALNVDPATEERRQKAKLQAKHRAEKRKRRRARKRQERAEQDERCEVFTRRMRERYEERRGRR